jgi:hypothetical protein
VGDEAEGDETADGSGVLRAQALPAAIRPTARMA